MLFFPILLLFSHRVRVVVATNKIHHGSGSLLTRFIEFFLPVDSSFEWQSLIMIRSVLFSISRGDPSSELLFYSECLITSYSWHWLFVGCMCWACAMGKLSGMRLEKKKSYSNQSWPEASMKGEGYSVFRLNSTIYKEALCLSLSRTAIKHQIVWIIINRGVWSVLVLRETLKMWQNLVQECQMW